jgi:hypothetical protein
LIYPTNFIPQASFASSTARHTTLRAFVKCYNVCPDVVELECDLERLDIRQMMLRTPPERVKGLATRAARAAHADLKAAAQNMA